MEASKRPGAEFQAPVVRTLGKLRRRPDAQQTEEKGRCARRVLQQRDRKHDNGDGKRKKNPLEMKTAVTEAETALAGIGGRA